MAVPNAIDRRIAGTAQVEPAIAPKKKFNPAAMMAQDVQAIRAEQAAAQAPVKPAPVVLPTLQKTAVDKVKVDTSYLTNQTALARSRASQDEATARQGNTDAISRRIAANAGAPGGVALKLEQMATDESARRLADANEGINAQEGAALAAVSQQEQQMNLAREEAQAGRDLQKYSTDIQTAMAKYGLDIGDYQFETGQQNAQKMQAEALKQQDLENKANNKVNIVNSIISMKNSNIPPEQIRAILNGLNLEGLGVDMSLFDGIAGITQTDPNAEPKQKTSLFDEGKKDGGKNEQWYNPNKYLK